MHSSANTSEVGELAQIVQVAGVVGGLQADRVELGLAGRAFGIEAAGERLLVRSLLWAEHCASQRTTGLEPAATGLLRGAHRCAGDTAGRARLLRDRVPLPRRKIRRKTKNAAAAGSRIMTVGEAFRRGAEQCNEARPARPSPIGPIHERLGCTAAVAAPAAGACCWVAEAGAAQVAWLVALHAEAAATAEGLASASVATKPKDITATIRGEEELLHLSVSWFRSLTAVQGNHPRTEIEVIDPRQAGLFHHRLQFFLARMRADGFGPVAMSASLATFWPIRRQRRNTGRRRRQRFPRARARAPAGVRPDAARAASRQSATSANGSCCAGRRPAVTQSNQSSGRRLRRLHCAAGIASRGRSCGRGHERASRG